MEKACGGRRRKEDLDMSSSFTFVAVICNNNSNIYLQKDPKKVK
jgi:hypothetical protein